ncbi:unnamed protein product [Oppiella nova]|uniref:CRAL-TRIO domain-containing protein n=1 Tax=Oppiella nova TaxID=334625 RepID=A0A7R9LKQ2_9ACAR|nr:unnamed protein product [Oppiella nova]CAG2164600.1 unnamed protein product [Oppiella nova]
MGNKENNVPSGGQVANELVEQLRHKFLDSLARDGQDYDPRDVEIIRTDDYSIRRFLTSNNMNASQAYSQLQETMRWRKEFPVQRDYSQCGVEVFRTGAMFIFENDREGRPVLYARVRTHVKIQELERLVEEVIVTTFEKLDQIAGEKGFTVVMDVSGAGLSNVDMRAVKFMITVMRKYYPESLKCVLVVNLPIFLRTFMPIVRILLGSKYSEMLHTVSDAQDLFNYIHPDNVPKYLGGNNCHDFTQPPAECHYKTEELSHLYGLSPTVVRKAIQKFEPHINDAKKLLFKSIDLNAN